MVYSLIRFVSILAMSWALSTPAGAQALAADDTAYYAYGLHYLVAAIGLVFAGYYAHNSFAAPIATPEDGPAPPRYMTQPNQYRMGMTAYIGSCLAAYVLIVVYYKDVAPLLELAAPPQFRQLIDDTIKQSSMSFPAVVVLGVVALVTLLRIEQEWNPLFAFRRLVWRWVSIPELVNQTTAAARDNLSYCLRVRLQGPGARGCDVLVEHAVAEDGPWSLLRVAHLHAPADAAATCGIYACSPQAAGYRVDVEFLTVAFE